MAKRKQQPTVKLERDKMLLIVSTQFFVFTAKRVRLTMLSMGQTSRLYDGLTLADNCRIVDPVVQREYVIRQTFGSDATGFLPANSVDCLMFLAESYKGPFEEEVKGICACILTGTPYGPEDANPGIDGGSEKIGRAHV